MSPRHHTRFIPLIVIGLLLGFLFPVQAQPIRRFQQPGLYGKPNVVMILIDDLGYADLGSYGQARIKTPNMDRLAWEGTRMTQCYAGSPAGGPSLAALLTGEHTGRLSIRGNTTNSIAFDETCLATVLKKTGFKTGMAGVWGVSFNHPESIPSRKGFDEWLGYLDPAQALDFFPPFLMRNDRQWAVPGNQGENKRDFALDWFTRFATNSMRINSEYPFFFCYACPLPRLAPAADKPGTSNSEKLGDAPYTQETWSKAEKFRASMLTRIDTDIGIILGRLKDFKIETNTIVVLSSINSLPDSNPLRTNIFKSNGPFRGERLSLNEAGIHVPMIIRWPGKIAAGSTNQQICAFWDLPPTLAEAVGAKPLEKINGISILPALLGKKQTNQHEYLYWECHEKGPAQAVRLGDWKGIRPAPSAPTELYDLSQDAGETKNVAAAHADIVARIEKLFKSARTESPHWPLKAL